MVLIFARHRAIRRGKCLNQLTAEGVSIFWHKPQINYDKGTLRGMSMVNCLR